MTYINNIAVRYHNGVQITDEDFDLWQEHHDELKESDDDHDMSPCVCCCFDCDPGERDYNGA